MLPTFSNVVETSGNAFRRLFQLQALSQLVKPVMSFGQLFCIHIAVSVKNQECSDIDGLLRVFVCPKECDDLLNTDLIQFEFSLEK